MKQLRQNNRAFALPIVLAILLVFMILLPALILWLQQDTKAAVKNQKNTFALNLAEAGIDRGMWRLKSSTTSFSDAASGTIIPGYNFDTTYSDISGGTYRIQFSSGPLSKQVTIWAEGRDSANRQTRSIKEVVQNQTIYSALMAGGNISWSKGLCVYWGPLISQGNLTMVDDNVAGWYFPRKYARGVVLGTAANPRDTNGLTPPNTDNTEWWSEYSVPDIPVLDFATMRSSAAATGTLNVYGCRSTQGGAGTNGSAVKWDTRASCSSGGAHATHFGNSWSHPKSAQFNPNTDYVWYWDGDVTLSGAYCGSSPCGQSTGLRGTVVVRGNLTIDTPGEFNYNGHVPANAWQEENRLTKTLGDTAASGEYPADQGLHTSKSTFNFGTDTWSQPLSGGGWKTTVGIKGFTYVGGNLTILQFLDFNGAVWVNGNATASGGTATAFCGIFYDDTLDVPALNVILIRVSWNEVAASTAVWM